MEDNSKILAKINIRTKEIYKEELKNLESNIRNMLEKAILSILGLERDGFRKFQYSVDHCNNRNSMLIDKIRETGKEFATKIISEISLSEEDLVSIKKACKEDLMRNIRDLLREEILHTKEKLIKTIVMEYEGEIKKEIKKQIGLIENIVENNNEKT